MPQSTKKFLTAVVSLILICAVSILTYAWFAGIKTIGSVNFSPSANAGLPVLDLWMYYSENDGATETDPERWVHFRAGDDPTGMNEYLVIPSIRHEAETDTNGETVTETIVDAEGNETSKVVYSASYEMSSLHFGKVDNLVTLNKDNKLMLRFYFNESVLNNTDGVVHNVKFTLRYNTDGYAYENGNIFDSIHLIREDGNSFTEVVLTKPAESAGGDKYVLEFREDEPGAMQFLQIRYAISTDGSYTPGEDGFEKVVTVGGKEQIDVLPLSNVVPINCGSAGAKKTITTPNEDGTVTVTETDEYICEKCANGTCGVADVGDSLFKNVLDSAENGGYLIKKDDVKDNNGEITDPGYNGFYVYIELAPLLDAFGMQENILDYFVPAFMFFDVKLDVEIG